MDSDAGAHAVESNDANDRLSRIATRLTMWLAAHQGEGEAALAARQALVLRYYGAVYRYLLGMLRDPAAAEDLTQEFAVRVLRGDFKRYDPERGRFRDFVKAAVRHLVMDHWKNRKDKQPQALSPGQAEPAAETVPEADFDQAFLSKWKEELIARTWEALQKSQGDDGPPYYTVLRCKTDQPEARSAQLADQLSAQLGKAVTGESVRQLVHRARRRFAELLVEEVGRSLNTTAPDRVAEELIELGLMCYCRAAVNETSAAQ
jgi:RNA polymerase sigma factor (sigma-70 family)